MSENKHYISIDSNSYVLNAFSDAFEEPKTGDICIEENGGRQFELFGIVNPSIKGINGAPLYKWENSKVVYSPKFIPPTPPYPTIEEQIAEIKTVLDDIILNGGAI